MNDKRFDKGILELKNKYNQSKPVSSPSDIFQAVRTTRKKTWFMRGYGGIAAASVSALLIAGILIGSMLTGNDMNLTGEDAVPLESGGGPDAGLGGNGEYNNNENLPDGAADTNGPNESREDADEQYKERPETVTENITVEGTEENHTLHLYIDEELGYSTYLEPQTVVTEDIYRSEQLIGREFKVTELFSITLLVHSEEDSSLDAIERSFTEQLEAEGYEESAEPYPVFETPDRQGQFSLAASSQRYYALLEHGGRVFSVHAEYPAESLDGRFPVTLKRFIDELVFK
ncbi:hypothetical protein MM300_14935 [Evansella sp. LMS18]|jgi:hypothetical protein|uniref:hypothetical protein n=1 Tax=Evansella sp. LMS18 TaxID=2924033 RepID=UPI0020D0FD21|nr:hypothetical protein [Evansella sp. LMS18]UTR09190.1 hypothetical protein MM300_14935 [Evansella sp. LMS18]